MKAGSGTWRYNVCYTCTRLEPSTARLKTNKHKQNKSCNCGETYYLLLLFRLTSEGWLLGDSLFSFLRFSLKAKQNKKHSLRVQLATKYNLDLPSFQIKIFRKNLLKQCSVGKKSLSAESDLFIHTLFHSECVQEQN